MSRWAPDRLDPETYASPGIDLPVLYNDLDPNNHLNNVALGRFFEHARIMTNLDAGLPDAMGDGNLIIGRVAIDYLAEGRLGSPLHVRTRCARLGSSSVVLEQAAWQKGTCIGLAEVVVVYLRGGQPTAMPEAVRAVFGRLRPA